MPAADVPHPPARSYSRIGIGLLIVLAGLILTLWLIGTPPGILGKADAVGYAICHRIPARSFEANGRPLPLCCRCTGIYLGVMTGLIACIASGRVRAARLPGIKIIVVLLAFGAAIAVDGLNSYLSLFEAYRPIYRPNNTLRLITGTCAGLTMILIMLPTFNLIVWRDPQPEAPLHTLKELAGLCLAAAGVIALVLVQVPALLVIAGLISTAGVVILFGMIGSVFFLTIMRRENSLITWRDLVIPALAGLVFAFSVIGSIDLVRYLLTGTWSGLSMLE
jgi:uncharacterized membrane protein